MKNRIQIVAFCIACLASCTYHCTAQVVSDIRYVDKKHGMVYVQSFHPVRTFNAVNTEEPGYTFIGNDQVYYRKNGRKKETSTYNYFYDAEGQLIRFVRYRNGKLRNSWAYTYSDSGEIVIAEKTDKDGNIILRVEQQFSKYGLIAYRSFDKRNKAVHRTEIVYNSDGRMTTRSAFRKDKLLVRTVYEFDDSGERSRTITYNKRGKVKYVWEYACDPRGDEVQKSDTSFICIRKESLENGGRMEVYVTTSEKGKISKRIYYYNAAEKLTKAEYYHKGSDQVRTILRYGYSGDNVVRYEYESYYDNGQIRYQTVENQGEQENVTLKFHSYTKRGRERNSIVTESKLNEAREVVSQISYNGKGQLIREANYSYH